MPVDSGIEFYRKKYISSLAFIVGVLLFLLPFVEIKCNDAPFAENTGVGLALGRDYKITGQMQAFGEGFSKTLGTKNVNNNTSKTGEKGKMYAMALAALLFGIAGIVVSLLKKPPRAIGILAGSLAVISLIILAIQLKGDINDQVKSTDTETVSKDIKVTVNFTIWYYLSIISFLAGSFFCYKLGTLNNSERPPKHAAQVPLHNPGEQSEFPTSPDESELER